MLGGFGFQQKPLDIVEKYCPRTNTWTTLPVLNISFIYKKDYGLIVYFVLVTNKKKKICSSSRYRKMFICNRWL
jgi:hypothetical protein